jgi:hypothetical protein
MIHAANLIFEGVSVPSQSAAHGRDAGRDDFPS